MKKIYFLFVLLFVSSGMLTTVQAQAFQDGEMLKLRIHYGLFNASYATLTVHEEKIGETPVYHVIGEGKSTGLLHAFYKVNDRYESYMDKNTYLPYRFIRRINEGGYTKNKVISYNHQNNTAIVRDLKHDTRKSYDTAPDVQDMISAFYYARNKMEKELKKPGDSIVINMFFDNKDFKFKTVYEKDEVIKTKFGRVKTMKLQPYVEAGRVFKKEQSLTIWVTSDKNKIPIRLKAKLTVGSITADLDEYKGLKYPFELVMK